MPFHAILEALCSIKFTNAMLRGNFLIDTRYKKRHRESIRSFFVSCPESMSRMDNMTSSSQRLDTRIWTLTRHIFELLFMAKECIQSDSYFCVVTAIERQYVFLVSFVSRRWNLNFWLNIIFITFGLKKEQCFFLGCSGEKFSGFLIASFSLLRLDSSLHQRAGFHWFKKFYSTALLHLGLPWGGGIPS